LIVAERTLFVLCAESIIDAPPNTRINPDIGEPIHWEYPHDLVQVPCNPYQMLSTHAGSTALAINQWLAVNEKKR
jgi:hypothetical protein